MSKTIFKSAMIATLTVATLATATLTTTTSAEAGRKDFWRGAAIGAATGIIAGSIARHHREREVVYVERHRPRTVVIEREVDGHAWGDRQHVRWCKRNYRTYNARTDMYKVRGGGRRYCESPYN